MREDIPSAIRGTMTTWIVWGTRRRHTRDDRAADDLARLVPTEAEPQWLRISARKRVTAKLNENGETLGTIRSDSSQMSLDSKGEGPARDVTRWPTSVPSLRRTRSAAAAAAGWRDRLRRPTRHNSFVPRRRETRRRLRRGPNRSGIVRPGARPSLTLSRLGRPEFAPLGGRG
jgi:hypothetical protein